MPENQELNPEFGFGMTPIDERLEEKTEDRVEEGEKHHRPSWQEEREGTRPVQRFGSRSLVEQRSRRTASCRFSLTSMRARQPFSSP